VNLINHGLLIGFVMPAFVVRDRDILIGWECSLPNGVLPESKHAIQNTNNILLSRVIATGTILLANG
jgi:hypothetical protein